MGNSFNKWLFEAISLYCGERKDPHDIFPHIDLTDAKLSFIDGMTPLEYSQEIRNQLQI